MVGEKDSIEAGLLRDSCAGANRRAVGLRTHIADCDSKLHRDSSGYVAGVEKDWQARPHPVKLLGHWEATTRGSSICEAAQALQSRREPRRCRPRVPRAR